ncbi:hypothetical protein MADA3029_1150018 [Vibrio nigripulchritudo MADA3029]|nr:hypothetical protein VIBNIMADA3020_630019 [Vibrio nigripulchritudo MADA3020]CCN51450.1 hypothetical protein VIBNIMADA3021_1080020 [Vibrio nigripulchritudo MADA3021]CCN57632.1 hypothetical protein MADA3029_1150018 [Vibrio nigripulchritudo MADA3029]
MNNMNLIHFLFFILFKSSIWAMSVTHIKLTISPKRQHKHNN